ncbi:MAG: hypothetical protein BAA04_09760 [Firmicutes bacterium ZCTH02-B6]|nr:MAG: hypothetical protein BAA04_09760 [Firmicutes bacterium ZCTH02-B6]
MEGLLAICAAEGVSVSYQPLAPERGLMGMYIRDGQRAGIILDVSLQSQPRLERTVMAEEVGHHFTVGQGSIFVIHFSYHTAIGLSRADELALRWGADYLVPTPALAEAIRDGLRNYDELADHFNTTAWMIRRKLVFLRQDLRREQGLRVKGLRDLFAPILVDALWGQASEEGWQTSIAS